MIYSVYVDNATMSAVADTYVTALAIRAADTAGYRARCLAITVGVSLDAPADLAITIQLKRVDDVSAGGAGTCTAVTPLQHDSLSRASIITGGHTYTVEPTTYGNQIFETEMNLRNTIIKEWTRDEAIIINRDQLLGMRIAPRSANAPIVSATMTYEEF